MSDKMKIVSGPTLNALNAAMEKHALVSRKLFEEFGYGHKPAQFVGFLDDVTETFALDMIVSIHDGLERNIGLLKGLREGTLQQTVMHICEKISAMEVPE